MLIDAISVSELIAMILQLVSKAIPEAPGAFTVPLRILAALPNV